jgi:hypothetical protein
VAVELEVLVDVLVVVVHMHSIQQFLLSLVHTQFGLEQEALVLKMDVL